MTCTRRWLALLASLLVLLLLATLAACATRTPAAGGSAAAPVGTNWVDLQLLAFNDFHGTLEPATGGNGRVGVGAGVGAGAVEAGGVEFLASHIARLKAESPNTIVVAAGDSIGASTFLSGMFHDEPTIEALGEAGLQIATVGNHEFDEGWAELYRMQKGGCHPVDGCQDGTPFAGARFEYLSANVRLDPAQVDPQLLARSGWRPSPSTSLGAGSSGPQTLFPATTVREIDGVKVGFIGLVVQATADIVSPAGLRGVTFRPEAEAGNEAAAALVRQGVRTIIVVIHEGGDAATADVNGCGITGPIIDIANGLSSEIDVIISGHTHNAYICTIGTKLVTSALSLGRLVTDVDLRIDRRTGDVVSKSARNVVVTRDVAKAAAITALIEHYRPFYATLGNRAVGTTTVPLTRAANAAGESALGDVIADAFLEATMGPLTGGAVLAFTNPGGIRADLVGQPSSAPGGPRAITFSNAFDTLPFGNRVVVRTLTGDALIRMLEQQFDNPTPGERKILQVSAGFSYRYDLARPRGQRIDGTSLTLGGRPVERAARYRVASSDFIWNGGDAFTVATEGTAPLDIGSDVDVFVEALQKHSPVAPGPQNRIIRTP